MSTILDTMPKGSGGGGGLSREEIVDHICEDLLSKVGRRVRPLHAWFSAGMHTGLDFTMRCHADVGRQRHSVSSSKITCASPHNAPPAFAPHHQVPPLFEKEETKERLRKLPGGASQPLTVSCRACVCAESPGPNPIGKCDSTRLCPPRPPTRCTCARSWTASTWCCRWRRPHLQTCGSLSRVRPAEGACYAAGAFVWCRHMVSFGCAQPLAHLQASVDRPSYRLPAQAPSP